MRGLVKFLAVLLLLAVVAAGGAWVWAGRQPGPTLQIRQPEKFIGQASTLDLVAEAPGGAFTQLTATLEQNGKSFPVFSLDQSAAGGTGGTGTPEGAPPQADRLFVIRPIGKRAIPELQSGPAKIVVTAARPVLRGFRTASTSLTRDVQVRLQPPQVSVQSRFHYINHGGAEFLVFTATPSDVQSGVRVGMQEYPSYPGSAVGIADPNTRVAFFALLHDQDLNAPIDVFARDEAGNQATQAVEHMPFEKPFQKSRIPIDDRFLQKVVPGIVANTPGLDARTDPAKPLEAFLLINGELRRENAKTIADLSKSSKPEMLWKENFQPLGNASVEAKYADSRTYVYNGKDVDQQVHLGFDLAVTAQVPILASQRGVVVHAAFLGIYGNCVILDHGLGVQTLYGHMSSIAVKEGQTVEKGAVLGRSGTTGLAAGDHLHFTVLVAGRPVNPVEWWDTKWMQDRVFRKISEAGGVR